MNTDEFCDRALVVLDRIDTLVTALDMRAEELRAERRAFDALRGGSRDRPTD